MTDERPRRSAVRTWARRVGPWLVAAGVLTLLLRRYSPADIARELGRGEVLPLLPVAAALVAVSVLLIAAADHLVLGRVVGRLPYWDVVRAKCASSLVDIVNYHAGHAGYAVWIARRSGADAPTTGGVFLYVMASDLTAICLVACLSIALAGDVVPPALRVAAPAVAATLVALKLIGPFRLLGDASPRVFAPWSALSRRRAMAQLAVRTGQALLGVLGTWIAIRAFGLSIPLWAVAAYLPLALFVGALPVNVGGFGAVQTVWLLFTEWVPGEQILAFNFVWQVTIGGAIMLRGVPFVRGFVREIDEGRANAAPGTAA